ncbi:MAG: hypothetical protein E7358_03035 [Clostridiales bacterium]|nr:hypothetical protein [Clostridiales bacterium]
MKDGKLIALSAVSTALGVIFLVIGAYFQTFDLSALFMSSIAMMLPLSKNSIKGAVFTYFATSLLSFCFALSRFYVPLLYVLFFGIHPIINYIQLNSKKKLWFLYVVKCIWFIGVVFLMYYALTMFVVEIESIKKFIPIILVVAGAVFYVAYDFIMIRFQKMSFNLIKRLGL